MSCIEGLLRDSGPALEQRLHTRLQGFFGAMLRHYLPQTWVFRTEGEVASLCVDEMGSVRVFAGTRSPADVTIEVAHDRLHHALTQRSAPPGEPEGSVAVTTHTAKGKAVYGLLRDRLGLSS